MAAHNAEQDTEFVKELEARFTSRAGFPITLEGLVSSWGQFVAEVECGYEDSIDDYTNDLTTRDLLDEALQSAPERLRRTLYESIRPLDDRFYAATRADESGTLANFFKPGPSWWWRRAPVNGPLPRNTSLREE